MTTGLESQLRSLLRHSLTLRLQAYIDAEMLRGSAAGGGH